jgi:hypothetical protein
MTTTFRNIERARGELTQLHGELLQLEKRVNSVLKGRQAVRQEGA